MVDLDIPVILCGLNLILYGFVMMMNDQSEINTVDISIQELVVEKHIKIFTHLLGFITVIGILFLIALYRESVISRYSILISLFVIIVYSINTWANINLDPSTPRPHPKVYNFLRILILCVMFLFGIYLATIYGYDKKKKTLTLVVTLYIVYFALSYYFLTEDYRTLEESTNEWNSISSTRYNVAVIVIFFIIFINKAPHPIGRGHKTVDHGITILLLALILYNLWILIRSYKLVSRYTDYVFPIILLSIFAITNYEEFKGENTNVMFVYGLGFAITMFLLYIITTSDDTKIKSFVTIFLVVIYNILAIIYGSKGCEKVSGIKLLKRVGRWSALIVIISLVLWNDFFQTSIGDTVKNITDEGDDLDATDTQELQEALDRKKGETDSPIQEGDKSDERVQLQSEINRLYESRTRRSL